MAPKALEYFRHSHATPSTSTPRDSICDSFHSRRAPIATHHADKGGAASAAASAQAAASAAAQRRRYGCIAADARIPCGRHPHQCSASGAHPRRTARARAHVVQALLHQPRLARHVARRAGASRRARTRELAMQNAQIYRYRAAPALRAYALAQPRPRPNARWPRPNARQPLPACAPTLPPRVRLCLALSLSFKFCLQQGAPFRPYML
jgi:hypothetical protein